MVACTTQFAPFANAEPNPSGGGERELEVPIQRIFFPATGYDNNDNVQIRVVGVLPDPCYVLGRQKITRGASPSDWIVHQYAWRRNTGICDTGDLLEETPFSEDVSLGRMKAGIHRIGFLSEGSKPEFKPITVEPARVSTLDDVSYLHVSDLSVPAVILQGKKAVMALGGILPNTCNQVTGALAVQWQGDVAVIRPVEVLGGGDCAKIVRTFELSLDLGLLPPGEYLIHVRSRGGKAVQKTFRVLKAVP